MEDKEENDERDREIAKGGEKRGGGKGRLFLGRSQERKEEIGIHGGRCQDMVAKEIPEIKETEKR